MTKNTKIIIALVAIVIIAASIYYYFKKNQSPKMVTPPYIAPVPLMKNGQMVVSNIFNGLDPDVGTNQTTSPFGYQPTSNNTEVGAPITVTNVTSGANPDGLVTDQRA